MINTKLCSLLLAIFLTTVIGASPVSAQITQPATVNGDPLATLPASDVIGFVNLRRIMTEVVPRIFVNDPATLAKMTIALDEVNKKTGVNILSVDRIVVGLRFYGTTFKDVKKEDVGIVIIVHGDFDPNAFLAAVKRETKGKGTEETYGGKVIYHEPMPAPPKKRAERETPAVTVLDANTIAIGDLPQIRAAIDAAAGNGRVDSALVQLATRDSSALVGSAVNVPESAKQSFLASGPKEEMPPGIEKIINSIKQIYVSIGATPADFNIALSARFDSAEQAQSVSDMLLGLRQQAGTQIPDQQTRALIDSVQITAQGDELQLRADIKNEVVQGLAVSMLKENKSSPKVAPGKAKPTTKSRKLRRRRRH
ncbi:MAG: hypothetical protein H0U54_13855 [Acidobacteria bacterium]|nr:hypothetical protein [Acidobacteriota bacterium]